MELITLLDTGSIDPAPVRPPRLKPFRLSPAASAHLDAIRAFAAVVVVLGHLRAMFFVDYQHVVLKSPFVNALYFLIAFGHQSVVVFFVLSGFLISSVIFRRHDAGIWSWKEYFGDRVVRLELVLVPGLLCGLLWDFIGLKLAPFLYTSPLPGLGDAVAVAGMNVQTFIGNALFLQAIKVPSFGSNGPLWSLSYEFWYYILFPALFCLVRSRRPWHVVSWLAFVASLLLFFPSEMRAGFLVWLLGVAVFLISSRFDGVTPPFLKPLSAGLWGLSLLAVRNSPTLPMADLLVGLTFSMFLLSILRSSSAPAAYQRIASGLSGFSYTLYVFHFPLLLCARAALLPVERWQPTFRYLVAALGVLGVVMAYSYFCSLITERQTKAVRASIRRALA